MDSAFSALKSGSKSLAKKGKEMKQNGSYKPSSFSMGGDGNNDETSASIQARPLSALTDPKAFPAPPRHGGGGSVSGFSPAVQPQPSAPEYQYQYQQQAQAPPPAQPIQPSLPARNYKQQPQPPSQPQPQYEYQQTQPQPTTYQQPPVYGQPAQSQPAMYQQPVVYEQPNFQNPPPPPPRATEAQSYNPPAAQVPQPGEQLGYSNPYYSAPPQQQEVNPQLGQQPPANQSIEDRAVNRLQPAIHNTVQNATQAAVTQSISSVFNRNPQQQQLAQPIQQPIQQSQIQTMGQPVANQSFETRLANRLQPTMQNAVQAGAQAAVKQGISSAFNRNPPQNAAQITSTPVVEQTIGASPSIPARNYYATSQVNGYEPPTTSLYQPPITSASPAFQQTGYQSPVAPNPNLQAPSSFAPPPVYPEPVSSQLSGYSTNYTTAQSTTPSFSAPVSVGPPTLPNRVGSSEAPISEKPKPSLPDPSTFAPPPIYRGPARISQIETPKSNRDSVSHSKYGSPSPNPSPSPPPAAGPVRVPHLPQRKTGNALNTTKFDPDAFAPPPGMPDYRKKEKAQNNPENTAPPSYSPSLNSSHAASPARASIDSFAPPPRRIPIPKKHDVGRPIYHETTTDDSAGDDTSYPTLTLQSLDDEEMAPPPMPTRPMPGNLNNVSATVNVPPSNISNIDNGATPPPMPVRPNVCDDVTNKRISKSYISNEGTKPIVKPKPKPPALKPKPSIKRKSNIGTGSNFNDSDEMTSELNTKLRKARMFEDQDQDQSQNQNQNVLNRHQDFDNISSGMSSELEAKLQKARARETGNENAPKKENHHHTTSYIPNNESNDIGLELAAKLKKARAFETKTKPETEFKSIPVKSNLNHFSSYSESYVTPPTLIKSKPKPKPKPRIYDSSIISKVHPDINSTSSPADNGVSSELASAFSRLKTAENFETDAPSFGSPHRNNSVKPNRYSQGYSPSPGQKPKPPVPKRNNHAVPISNNDQSYSSKTKSSPLPPPTKQQSSGAIPPPPPPRHSNIYSHDADTTSTLNSAGPPPPINKSTKPVSNKGAKPQPPPSRAAKWRPMELDLDLGSGWFAVEGNSCALPSSLQEVTSKYLLSYGYKNEEAFLILALQIKDLSQAKLILRWTRGDPSSVTVERHDNPPPESPNTEELNNSWNEFGNYIASWAEKKLGRQVGDGECWTLAADAIDKGCGHYAMRPVGYKHGALIYQVRSENGRILVDVPLKVEVKRGDIIQFTSAIFKDGNMTITMGSPNHTSIVTSLNNQQSVSGDPWRDTIEVVEQNVGGIKVVKRGQVNIKCLTAGKIEIFRAMPKSWIHELDTNI